jgi:hypothetical protein
MERKKNIYLELSKKYSINRNIVEVICNSPFSFAAKIIANDSDEKTIMFPFFGKLRLKKQHRGKKADYQLNREVWNPKYKNKDNERKD